MGSKLQSVKEESPRDYCCAIIKCQALLQKSMSGTRVSNGACQLKYPKMEVPRVWNWVCLTPHSAGWFCPFLLGPNTLPSTVCDSGQRRAELGVSCGAQQWAIRRSPCPSHRSSQEKAQQSCGRGESLWNWYVSISYLCPREPLLLIFSRILWCWHVNNELRRNCLCDISKKDSNSVFVYIFF